MENIKIFMDRFQVPEEAAPYLNCFFTDQEIRFVVHMEKKVFDKKDIEALLGGDTEDFIKSAYRRGIISYVSEEKNQWKLADFYERLDIFAVSEQEKYRSIPEEGQKAVSRWAFEHYYQRLDPDKTVRPTNDEILSLDEVLEFIEERKDKPVYLNYCDCKSLNGQCKKPRDTCITYKDGINTYVHRGLGKRIDAETAKEIVRRADRAGLMHTVNPTGICNCCDDCCYLFRSQKKRESAGFWPKTAHIISYHEDKCIGCGLCTRRCMFQVFQKEGSKVRMDNRACVGCGICATACPAKALELTAR